MKINSKFMAKMSEKTLDKSKPNLYNIIGGGVVAQTKEERHKRQNALHKKEGYSAQKKYNKEYKKKMYECRFYIKTECREELQQIADAQGTSLSRLFLNAVEEKYGIKLRENS